MRDGASRHNLSAPLLLDAWKAPNCPGNSDAQTEFTFAHPFIGQNMSNIVIARSFRLNRTLENQEQLDISVASNFAAWYPDRLRLEISVIELITATYSVWLAADAMAVFFFVFTVTKLFSHFQETIAELRRQLEEERKAREEAERLQGEAERRLQPNTLFRLLDRCHDSLSQAIRVETDTTLTTQGDATDPVDRLYPNRIVPWLDFPQLQEQVWRKFDRTAAFTSHYVVTNIQNKPIYSEASLRNFERDTVDNFVEMVIKELRDDEVFRDEFGIQGQVTFYDRANPSESSLKNSLEQMNLQDVRTPKRLANTRPGRGRGRGRGAAQGKKRDGTVRRRNRRADQFCVHLVADERQIPV
ncbi:hypothetical protein E8E15_000028, partial [Penicillium rubens]